MQGRWGRAFLAGSTCALALGPSAGASDLAALLEFAGLVRHVEAWPETNAEARERAEALLAAEPFALLLREVRAAFAAPALLGSVSEGISAKLDPGAIAQLHARYAESGAGGLIGPPIGIPASELRDFPRFASEVSRQEVPPARFTLVAKLDESTGLARDAWRVSGAVGHAIARGARALRCEAGAWRAPLPAEESDRSRLAGPFRERLHVELLFLTRNRATRDLRRALRFLESPPARAFHHALGEAVPLALESALRTLRQRLAKHVTERCS